VSSSSDIYVLRLDIFGMPNGASLIGHPSLMENDSQVAIRSTFNQSQLYLLYSQDIVGDPRNRLIISRRDLGGGRTMLGTAKLTPKELWLDPSGKPCLLFQDSDFSSSRSLMYRLTADLSQIEESAGTSSLVQTVLTDAAPYPGDGVIACGYAPLAFDSFDEGGSLSGSASTPWNDLTMSATDFALTSMPVSTNPGQFSGEPVVDEGGGELDFFVQLGRPFGD
jgi:hypothetical protein